MRREAGSLTTERRLVDAEDRFTARGRRRRPLTRALTVLLVIALLAGLAWVALGSQVLAVRTVAVEGLSKADAGQVRDELAGVVGVPLLRVDTADVRDRVGAREDIAHVSVRRSFPSTLVVRATVRTPVLVVRHPDGVLRVVDVEGVTFGTVSRPPDGVPVISSISDGDVSPEAVTSALAVLRELPDDLRLRMRDLQVGESDLLSFRIGDTEVVWGTGEQSALKAKVVRVLLTTHPEAIDVSAPETPVTR